MRLTPVILGTCLLLPAAGQLRFSNGSVERSYGNPQEANDAETYLKSHPDDRRTLKRLLDYYELHWQETQSDRLRVILWTIEHHPNIDLDAPYDSRSLLLNPDDRQEYQEARQLWLKQIEQHPGDPRILENAAICLRLTDRESAAGWLKQAMRQDPARRSRLTSTLADVYAAAIAGVSGMNPWEAPTSVDKSETGSGFALRARAEAMAEADLAARTGWALYLTTEAFQRLKVSDRDYDALAEELLLKSAAFDYPKPAHFPSLGTFYQRQETKKSGRIYPRSRIVTVAPE